MAMTLRVSLPVGPLGGRDAYPLNNFSRRRSVLRETKGRSAPLGAGPTERRFLRGGRGWTAALPKGTGAQRGTNCPWWQAYWVEARWGGTPACPRCKSTSERGGFLFECSEIPQRRPEGDGRAAESRRG